MPACAHQEAISAAVATDDTIIMALALPARYGSRHGCVRNAHLPAMPPADTNEEEIRMKICVVALGAK